MRKRIYIHLLYLLGIISFVALLIFSYWKLNTSGFLFFSDGAKFADVARNLLVFGKYGSSFKFFSAIKVLELQGFPFAAPGILPGMPIVLYIFFLFFGVSDFSVALASSVLFLLSLVFIFLLGKKNYGAWVGLLAALLVGTNINFVQYSLNGASEILLVLELLLAVYLITLKTRVARFGVVFMIGFMYLTRFNAVAYIVPLIFFWLVSEYGVKKGILRFIFVFLIGVIADRIILGWLDGKYFIYQILSNGSSGIVSIAPGESPSNYLRMPIHEALPIREIAIKIFYNVYNFYKFIPQIFSPYLFSLFLIGLFLPSKNTEASLFKFFSLMLLITSVLVYSLTIPFFRYIHPVIPFLYLIALGTLNNLVGDNKKGRLISLVFAIFVLISSLGTIFLDSRYLSDTVNRGKPPIYVVLSNILKENTTRDEIVITNLDTWGSWYGERKTIWYPLKPEQLNLKGGENPPDAIFLTSYLMDDENYYMGPEWRQAFLNPNKVEDKFISQNYTLKGIYTVKPEENYERQESRAVLLVRK